MKVLIVGQRSYIATQFSKYISKNSSIDLWKTLRCDKNGDCNHELSKTICVSKTGQLLSKEFPNYDSVFIFTTFYSKKPELSKEVIDCNVIFLSNLCSEIAEKTLQFVNLNTYLNLANPHKYRNSMYAISKNCFSEILRQLSIEKEINFVDLTLFDVIGPGDSRTKFPNLIAAASKTNEKLRLSPGEQLLFPTFVEDVTEILLDISLKNEKDGEYQVRPIEHVTLKRYLDILVEIFKFEVDVQWGAIEYFGDELFSVPNIPKIYPLTRGYTNLVDGLKLSYGELFN